MALAPCVHSIGPLRARHSYGLLWGTLCSFSEPSLGPGQCLMTLSPGGHTPCGAGRACLRLRWGAAIVVFGNWPFLHLFPESVRYPAVTLSAMVKPVALLERWELTRRLRRLAVSASEGCFMLWAAANEAAATAPL